LIVQRPFPIFVSLSLHYSMAIIATLDSVTLKVILQVQYEILHLLRITDAFEHKRLGSLDLGLSIDESTIWTYLGLYFNRFSVLKCIFCLNNLCKFLKFRYLDLGTKHGHY